jgi:hypothetical protein
MAKRPETYEQIKQLCTINGECNIKTPTLDLPFVKPYEICECHENLIVDETNGGYIPSYYCVIIRGFTIKTSDMTFSFMDDYTMDVCYPYNHYLKNENIVSNMQFNFDIIKINDDLNYDIIEGGIDNYEDVIKQLADTDKYITKVSYTSKSHKGEEFLMTKSNLELSFKPRNLYYIKFSDSFVVSRDEIDLLDYCADGIYNVTMGMIEMTAFEYFMYDEYDGE